MYIRDKFGLDLAVGMGTAQTQPCFSWAFNPLCPIKSVITLVKVYVTLQIFMHIAGTSYAYFME